MTALNTLKGSGGRWEKFSSMFRLRLAPRLPRMGSTIVEIWRTRVGCDDLQRREKESLMSDNEEMYTVKAMPFSLNIPASTTRRMMNCDLRNERKISFLQLATRLVMSHMVTNVTKNIISTHVSHYTLPIAQTTHTFCTCSLICSKGAYLTSYDRS